MTSLQSLRHTVLIGIALVLSGCVQPPKQIYLWESFPRQQYAALLREGASQEEQIRAMEAHAEKARASGVSLPPGFRAHLGMLQLAAGKPDSARQLWAAEKVAFPESVVYIDSLLKRLNAPSNAPSSAPAKDNPA